MTRDARIAEISAELNHMDNTLSGCDWCEGCGNGIVRYTELVDELRDLEGAYLRVQTYEGKTELSTPYDFTTGDHDA
jgi:hypothetical protein